MTTRLLILCFLSALIFNRCNCYKEIDCFDRQIYPAFVGFPVAEVDTVIIRKFKAASNYQVLLDTFRITYSNYYRVSGDTIRIYPYPQEGIRAGFDWQIFVPAINKTVQIAAIVGNKNTIRCGARAVGSACSCANDLFSLDQDNQRMVFHLGEFDQPYVYMRR